jgi:hypothetical protein
MANGDVDFRFCRKSAILEWPVEATINPVSVM